MNKMSDGLLDEIEKSIDDFSIDMDDEINNEVKVDVERAFNSLTDSWERKRYETQIQEKQTIRVEHVDCDCGTHIILTTKKSNESFYSRQAKQTLYQIYCPVCSCLWKLRDMPVEIKVRVGY